jgi:hypothetical protein
MPYTIHCRRCQSKAWLGNIVELLTHHTNEQGYFICSICEQAGRCGTDTSLWIANNLLETGEIWAGWATSVIRLDAGEDRYVFVMADYPGGRATGLYFNRYNNDRVRLQSARQMAITPERPCLRSSPSWKS